MSRPIVVIVCMDAPPNRGSFNSAHIFGTHVPGGGAVHSIKTGLPHRSKRLCYSITSSTRSFALATAKSPAAFTRGRKARWRPCARGFPRSLCAGVGTALPTHDALDHHGRDAREHGLGHRG